MGRVRKEKGDPLIPRAEYERMLERLAAHDEYLRRAAALWRRRQLAEKENERDEANAKFRNVDGTGGLKRVLEMWLAETEMPVRIRGSELMVKLGEMAHRKRVVWRYWDAARLFGTHMNVVKDGLSVACEIERRPYLAVRYIFHEKGRNVVKGPDGSVVYGD